MRVVNFIVLLFATGAAKQLLLAPGPSNTSLYVAPAVYDHELIGPLDDAPAAGAGWYIAQWSNPTPFSNATKPISGLAPCLAHTGAGWHIASPNMRVCASQTAPGAVMLELGQNGGAPAALLPCGVEMDAFLSPTDDANTPKYGRNLGTFMPLAALNSLNVSFDIQLPYASITPRCGTSPQCSPSPDYAYAVLGLSLDNVEARQSMFYQVILYDSRSAECPQNDPCLPFSFWFQRNISQGLGVSDSVALLTQSPTACIRAGDPLVAYDFALLDTLEARIQYAAQKFGADPNVTNWAVHGMYIGTGIQGSAATVALVGNVSITYS